MRQEFALLKLKLQTRLLVWAASYPLRIITKRVGACIRMLVIANVDAAAVVLVVVTLPVALILLVQTEQSAFSFCICPALGKKPLKSPINDLKDILVTAHEQKIPMPKYLYDEACDAIGV